jgi:polyferredoxin
MAVGTGTVWAQEQSAEPSSEAIKDQIESTLDEDAFENLDGFESLDDGEVVDLAEVSASDESHHRGLRFALIALAFAVLAGLFVRFKRLRTLRTAFLLGSLIVLGFWNGGCPCPISSFQNLVLWMNADVKVHSIVWFLGLVPVTYVFGRVWCGWVCHLGALQEFLHKPSAMGALQSVRAQKVMRWLRYGLFTALIVQLVLTRENLFVHVDPFKVAFNLRSFYLTGWILLAILLVSSLYIYRPFCRSACPVGLVLGWVSRIPYASKLGINEDCRTCKLCTNACAPQAIQAADRKLSVRHEECIACGTCMDACRKECISFKREETNDARTMETPSVVDSDIPILVNKPNGKAKVRERSGGAPQAREGRLESVVGGGADRPSGLSRQ